MDNSWVFEKEPEETGIAEDAVSETSDIEEPIAGDHESEIQSGDEARNSVAELAETESTSRPKRVKRPPNRYGWSPVR